MTNKELLCDLGYEDSVVFDNPDYDEAIIGVSHDGRVIYDIDLMVEHDDYINIIDYKLKNIDDKNYEKQLLGYQKYIKGITDKETNIYLYSIIDGVYKKLN